MPLFRPAIAAILLSFCCISPALAFEQSTTPDATTNAASPLKPSDADPYLWLEALDEPAVLEWIEQQNQMTSAALETLPHFDELQTQLFDILSSQERLPEITKLGKYYYNLQTSPQYLWQRTTLKQYRRKNTRWDPVFDIMAYGNDTSGTNWFWEDPDCLAPDYERCLFFLSRGGADANTNQEFDLKRKRFVEKGFYRTEDKGFLTWKDKNTVYLATEQLGDGTTAAGYPRVLREWKRGTLMSASKKLFELAPTDLQLYAYHDYTPDHEYNALYRYLDFYRSEFYLLPDDAPPIKIDTPLDADKYLHRGWLFLRLRSPYQYQNQHFATDSLIVSRLADFQAGKAQFQTLFTPTEHSALHELAITHDYIIINYLDDVKPRLAAFKIGDPPWQAQEMVGVPAVGTITVKAVDGYTSNEYFMTVSDYLTPDTLYLGTVGQQPERLKQSKALFDASPYRITQHFATSDDGTRIPYFQVAAKQLKHDGKNPTLLTGYGGFEQSLTPYYDAMIGQAWLAKGGVYVVANIRGGGEYGPRWHQAALKEKRHKAFEDFAAVARDLSTRQVTSPAHLGIEGGSNGGLLAGNMLTQYADLVGAIIIDAPLLDMQRFSVLSAGAAWEAEYGNPDTNDWQYLQQYSPYHQVKADKNYPPVLLLSSTRDDRVHPAHARKMAARLHAQNHPVWYYETGEGGHGGASNSTESAYIQALKFTFLYQHLMQK